MQRFKNILFVNEPGTDKTSAPQSVVELARSHKARLTLCDVSYELAPGFNDLSQPLADRRKQRLEALLEGVDTRGVIIEHKLLTGVPVEEVIRQVKRGNHDLVIKNADPGGEPGSRSGSSDSNLMQECPVPLRILPADDRAVSEIHHTSAGT